MRRNWEVTAMCINCEHYDHFLITWKTFFVQCSYANAALLPKRRWGGHRLLGT